MIALNDLVIQKVITEDIEVVEDNGEKYLKFIGSAICGDRLDLVNNLQLVRIELPLLSLECVNITLNQKLQTVTELTEYGIKEKIITSKCKAEVDFVGKNNIKKSGDIKIMFE